MSTTTTCDRCGESVAQNNPDGLIDWLVVGYNQTTPYDVCSFRCAHALLKDMAKTESGAAA